MAGNSRFSGSGLRKRVESLLSPFESFVNSQVSTGVFLLIATAVALAAANSPLHAAYEAFRHWEFGFIFERWRMHMPLLEWVNSGLMSMFFFLIGLEIKREILAGELRDRKKLMLVLFAALGGMLMPALIFLSFNHGAEAGRGWAIPMATDTAFALGAFALLGRKSFTGLATFLTALAIVDDIGSIIVIAFYYTHTLVPAAFLKAGCVLLLLVLFNVTGIRRAAVYFITGAFLWAFMQESGMHAQVAGILVAATVPARRRHNPKKFLRRMQRLMSVFEARHKGKAILSDQKQHELVMAIEKMAEDASTPLQRWETKTSNLISLVILPVFAFLNAGISLRGFDAGSFFSSPVMAGITLGLVAGKPIGITLFSWLAIRSGFGRMPHDMDFSGIAGIGLLAGMGFTMSFLIATMSFPEGSHLVESSKLAILTATFISGLLGIAWLAWRGKESGAQHGKHAESKTG